MFAPLMVEDRDALLACPPGSRTEELARKLGIATAPLPYRPLRVSAGMVQTLRSSGAGILAAHDLRRVVRSHPERRVILCTSIRPALVAAIACAGLDRRLVWSVTDFLPPPPLGAATRMLARMSATHILASSQALAANFADGSGSLRTRTRVVYPGVDVERFDPSLAAPGSPLAAIVGHISPTKRTDLAVRVAARVAERVPGFRLRIIGRAQFRDEDFELERRLRREVAKDRRLRDVIEFRDYEPEIGRALAGVGLLLHARPDEPFGIVVVEAMAMGLPVVVPASAGPGEIVEHGRTGLLYRPLDESAAADAVVSLIREPERAAAMGAAARDAVARRFSLAEQLRRTRAVIAEAAS